MTKGAVNLLDRFQVLTYLSFQCGERQKKSLWMSDTPRERVWETQIFCFMSEQLAHLLVPRLVFYFIFPL